MAKICFPPEFHSWPVRERANWFDIELSKEGLATLFRRAVGLETEPSKGHLTVAEVAEGLKLLEGRPVIEPKHEREECLQIYREKLGLETTDAHYLTGMEIGHFLAEMYDDGQPGLPVPEYTVSCSWNSA